MRMSVFFVFAYLLALIAHAAPPDATSSAEELLNRFLIAHQGPDSRKGAAWQDETVMLRQLLKLPAAEVVPVIEEVLRDRATPSQRSSIVGVLGRQIHTREWADVLYRLVKDVRVPSDKDAARTEELVRSKAVRGLSRLAARQIRSGDYRVRVGPDSEPKVAGIAPYFIAAAMDPSDLVRVTALYGLADSRDPAAVRGLREHLTDESDRVRLYAACFLTEYKDATGLPEMRRALERFRVKKVVSVEDECYYYPEAGMLLTSFERITGQSFGKVPRNPGLFSAIKQQEAAKDRFSRLIDVWSEWWRWQPTESIK